MAGRPRRLPRLTGPRQGIESDAAERLSASRSRRPRMQQPMDSPHSTDFPRSGPRRLPGQIVLVLQGGGALGSYQAGVYQALQEADIEPDWIIGTSIGAINASLIAGNEPQRRLERLQEFWKRMEQSPAWNFGGVFPG